MPQPGEEEQGELPEDNEGAGKMQQEALCRVQGSKACAQNLGSGPVTGWTVRWVAEDSVGKASVPSEPRPQNQETKQQDKTKRAEGSPRVIKVYFWTTKKRENWSKV